MKHTLLVASLVLFGCDRVDEQKTREAKYLQSLSTVEGRGIGRFQMIQAAGAFPPMMVDTATGCVWAMADPKSFKFDFVTLPDGAVANDACFTGDRPKDPIRSLMK